MYLIEYDRRDRVRKNGFTIIYKAMGAPLRRKNYTHTHTLGSPRPQHIFHRVTAVILGSDFLILT